MTAHAFQLHTGDLPETLRQLNLTLAQLDRRIAAIEANFAGSPADQSISTGELAADDADFDALTSTTGTISSLTATTATLQQSTIDNLSASALTGDTVTIAHLRAVAGDSVNLTDEWAFPSSVWNGDLAITGRHEASQISGRELTAPDAWLGQIQGDTATLVRATLEGLVVNAAGLTGEWDFPSWRVAGDVLAGRITAAQLEAAALVSDDAWLLAVAGDTATWNRLQVIGAALDAGGLTGEVEFPSWTIQADLNTPSCHTGWLESQEITAAVGWIGALTCHVLTGTRAALDGMTLAEGGLTGETEFPSWTIQADLNTPSCHTGWLESQEITAVGGWIGALNCDALTGTRASLDGIALAEGGLTGEWECPSWPVSADLLVSGGVSLGGPLVVAGGADVGGGLGVGGFTIDASGNVRLRGEATSWDDLRVEPTVRGTGARNPAFEQYLSTGTGSIGVFLYSFDDASAGSEKEIYFTMQMPHAWAGTAIYMHVHWLGNVDDTVSAPYWGLEYSWSEIGQVFGNTVIVYTDGINYTGGGTDPNITALKHYLSLFAPIIPSASQDGLSSILIGRLFRHSSNVLDTYNAGTNKCGLLYIDAHYEIDSFGSNSEYVK